MRNPRKLVQIILKYVIFEIVVCTKKLNFSNGEIDPDKRYERSNPILGILGPTERWESDFFDGSDGPARTSK